jgi:intracellular proteinase inhibitor BsuPI
MIPTSRDLDMATGRLPAGSAQRLGSIGLGLALLLAFTGSGHAQDTRFAAPALLLVQVGDSQGASPLFRTGEVAPLSLQTLWSNFAPPSDREWQFEVRRPDRSLVATSQGTWGPVSFSGVSAIVWFSPEVSLDVPGWWHAVLSLDDQSAIDVPFMVEAGLPSTDGPAADAGPSRGRADADFPPRLLLTADPSTAAMGAPVALSLTVSNLAPFPVTLLFPTGQQYDFVVSRAGEAIWRWSADKLFIEMFTRLTLGPGEQRRFAQSWNQHDNDGHPVAPGAYDVSASLGALQAVTVPLNIVEQGELTAAGP